MSSPEIIQGALLPVPSDAAFEALYREASRIGIADCWTHCGSYCCKTNHPDQQFALMKCDSAGLVYSLAEYRFLERRGALQEGAVETTRFHEFIFDRERDLRLRFVTTICELGGRCSDPAHRPLICKFYPSYPAPATDAAALSSQVIGSIIDQHWSDVGVEHPCWIVREKLDEVIGQAKTATALIEDHPYLHFYIGAAAIFVRHVAARCRHLNLPAPGTDLRQFFRDWEVRYLSGRLVDTTSLRGELTSLYDLLATRWGSFEL